MIAYWTAYFKANYPEEYMAAVMNAHSGQTDKIATDVAECLRLGIPVLLPDVNHSECSLLDRGARGRTARDSLRPCVGQERGVNGRIAAGGRSEKQKGAYSSS